jgi:chromosome segregation ATPase
MFSPMGLKRGKKKVERIADNEPRHKIIHRSVRELHHDLQLELDAAYKKLEKMQKYQAIVNRQLVELQQKYTDYTDKIKRLEKRLEVYKRREQDALKRLEKLSAALSIFKHTLDEQQLKTVQSAVLDVKNAFSKKPAPDDLLDQDSVLGNKHQDDGFNPSN